MRNVLKKSLTTFLCACLLFGLVAPTAAATTEATPEAAPDTAAHADEAANNTAAPPEEAAGSRPLPTASPGTLTSMSEAPLLSVNAVSKFVAAAADDDNLGYKFPANFPRDVPLEFKGSWDLNTAKSDVKIDKSGMYYITDSDPSTPSKYGIEIMGAPTRWFTFLSTVSTSTPLYLRVLTTPALN